MHIKKFIISFFILVLGGYLFLALVYCLPTEKISENVAEAALAFQNEGLGNQINNGGGGGNFSHDNFTDALMLLSAENANDENPFVEALKVERLTFGNQFTTNTLIALHTGENQEYDTISYARYWHGYLVFLKPLLLIFSYQQIRYILLLVQLGLVSVVIWLLAAKGKGLYCVPVVLAYFFLNPAACSLSMQYNSVLVLTMAELVVILLREEQYAGDKRLWLYHFFLTGCLTSYFDLLTYPVVTLGIPVIFLISQYEENWKEGLRDLLGSCLLWGTGYVAMWAGKWTLSSLITGKNILGEAIMQISYRMGSDAAAEAGVSEIGRLNTIGLNLTENKFSLILIFIAFVVCCALSGYRKTFRFRGRYIPIALAGLLPFAWYVVITNHSFVHSWMTFRALAVFVYALMTVGVMLMEKPNPVMERKNQVEKR